MNPARTLISLDWPPGGTRRQWRSVAPHGQRSKRFPLAAYAGSGLGLCQVQGFARQSGGDVHIASTSGRGTTVTLLLPQVDAVAS